MICIYTRLKGSENARRTTQPITTILTIMLAASGCFVPGGNLLYSILIMFGLIFCLVGDCSLVSFKGKRLFVVAVGFYGAGLIVYSGALTHWTGFNLIDLAALIVLLAGSGLILGLFFWKGMKKIKVPIIIYMVIWCYLLCQSLTIFWSDSDFFSTTQKWFLLLGTGTFFLGDFAISCYKFNERFKNKRLWIDIPLYYTGQGLIALSTSFF